MLEETEIQSWEDFDYLLGKNHYRQWIYRGQSDSSWNMESSIHRAFENAQSIHALGQGQEKKLNRRSHEIVMLDKFKCNAHLYLNHLPQQEDDFSWLSLMQHHGAPTRLLDFSFSFYVALYFALESGENDASIYCINHDSIKNDDDFYFGEERLEVYKRILDGQKNKDDECLFAFEPTFSNQRILSQQGLFVATNTLKYTHEKILNDYQIHKEDAFKIIIPKELRLMGLKKLHQMNINSTNIYPGLDGFSKSLIKQPVFGLQWQKRVGNEL